MSACKGWGIPFKDVTGVIKQWYYGEYRLSSKNLFWKCFKFNLNFDCGDIPSLVQTCSVHAEIWSVHQNDRNTAQVYKKTHSFAASVPHGPIFNIFIDI